MANKTITDLTEVTTLGNNDVLATDTAAGATRKVTKANLLKEVNASISSVRTTVGEHTTEITNLKNSVSDGKTQVASAITAKGVATSATDTFATMATNISNIPTGGGSTGNATEADVLTGKTFSNASGTGKTGTMPNKSGGANATAFTKPSASDWFRASAPEGYYAEGSAVWVNPNLMGDAKAEDVATGKTFTSQNGLKLTGTASAGGAEATLQYSNTWTYANTQQTITVPASNKALIFVSGKSLYGASTNFVTATTTAGTLTNITQKNVQFSGATGSTNSVFLLEGAASGASVTIKFPTSQNTPNSYDAFISVVKIA